MQRRQVLNKNKLALLIIVSTAITSFFVLGGHEYLSLEYLRDSRAQFETFYQQHPILLPVIFFGFYVAVSALSLPGAAVMTLAAGALFGLSTGVVLVSFASSAGATLAFLAARWLLRDTVQRRMGDRLETVRRGIERDGGFYLFSMRLVPAIPFFLINLAMGLTPIRAWTFYWVSQLGMLPGTFVYVNAGTQLADMQSLQGLLSLDIVGAFLLLAAFPWAGKLALRVVQRRRALRGGSGRSLTIGT